MRPRSADSNFSWIKDIEMLVYLSVHGKNYICGNIILWIAILLVRCAAVSWSILITKDRKSVV